MGSKAARTRNNRLKKQFKSTNPFESQVVKTKKEVLGRKVRANQGAPGKSRKIAEKQRENTIGVDLFNKNKTNKLVDNRINAKDGTFQRLTKLKKRGSKTKSKYHLESSSEDEASSDDDFLTHKGTNLDNIKNHFVQGSEDLEVTTSQRQMAESNFGGGTFIKPKQSRESAIDEMIKQSKLKKLEKSELNEENARDVEEMDEKWFSYVQKLTMMDKYWSV